jgi:hypothetical protein
VGMLKKLYRINGPKLLPGNILFSTSFRRGVVRLLCLLLMLLGWGGLLRFVCFSLFFSTEGSAVTDWLTDSLCRCDLFRHRWLIDDGYCAVGTRYAKMGGEDVPHS